MRLKKRYEHFCMVLARNLRNNQTRHERRLWYDFLSAYPIRFSRQKVIGNYIVDFFCQKAMLAVELDGSQHFSDKGQEKDNKRTEDLQKYGIEVLRFANSDIDGNFAGVCTAIDNEVKKRLYKTNNCPENKRH